MKIKPIVLASGAGTRFGGNKLIEPIMGKPMFRHIVDILAVLNLKGVLEAPLVVTKYTEITEFLEQQHIDFVINKNALAGISSSIKAGISAVCGCDFYMFFTADQPYITTETIEGFVTKFLESGKPLGCVESQDKTGNPTIFSCSFNEHLLALEGDCGGKKIIKENLEQVFLYSVEKKELWDIDEKNSIL